MNDLNEKTNKDFILSLKFAKQIIVNLCENGFINQSDLIEAYEYAEKKLAGILLEHDNEIIKNVKASLISTATRAMEEFNL